MIGWRRTFMWVDPLLRREALLHKLNEEKGFLCPARGQPLSLATSFKRRRSLRCWGSQIAVEWQDEIAAYPRYAAFARCLPIAQPIPRLRPACLPHEHPGGLKATGTIERRMRDGDQPPPKRKKIRRRRRRDNHDDD
jgi:hypothetical protein